MTEMNVRALSEFMICFIGHLFVNYVQKNYV